MKQTKDKDTKSNKREIAVKVYFSKSEYSRLFLLYGQSRFKNKNRFIRDRIFNNKRGENIDIEIAKGIIFQLRKIGNNLNQITKEKNDTNTYNKQKWEEIQKKLLDTLNKTYQQIK